MAEKRLLTRIIMNHGEWASYAGKVAKDGEVIYVKVGTTQAKGQVSEPIWMQKIGDGVTQVQSLPWVVAPAADVYEWAKKAKLDWKDVDLIPGDKLGITALVVGNGNAVTDASWDAESKTLTLTKGETFATKGYADDELAKKADKVTGATAGNFAGLDENGNLTDSGKKAADFAEAGHSHEIAASGDDEITATGGTLSVDVKHKEHLTTTYTTKASTGVSEFGKSATLNIPSLEVNKYGHITKAEDKEVTISIPGLNEVAESSHTHTNGKGTVVSGEGSKAIDLNVKFKSDLVEKDGKKYLQIVDATDETKLIAEFDSSEFIKDGFLQSVTTDTKENQIIFTWNTDAGVTETPIDIDDLVEVYTSGEGVTIENFVVSHAIPTTVATNVTKTARTYVSGIEFDKFGHVTKIETGVEEDQDLTHNHDDQYKKLQTVVEKDGAADKTITKVTQNENGEVDVTYEDIAITSSQVIDLDVGVTKVSTTANNGLKVTPKAGTGDVVIDIDDTIVFILDGGDASDLD